MQMSVYGKNLPFRALISRLCCFLLLSLFSVPLLGQSLSFSFRAVPLEEAFREIEKKTDYRFVYAREALATAQPVSFDVKTDRIEVLLQKLFENESLSYSLNKNYISVQQRADRPQPAMLPPLEGRVVNESGAPIAGASVELKKESAMTVTDADGRFRFEHANPGGTLRVSSVGYAAKEIAIGGRKTIDITLAVFVQSLDETVVIAYGTTTNRLNTGNVTRVTAEEISKQPVSNPLAALQGRVPGMIVTQSSGVAGSAFQVMIRGRNALDLSLAKSDPLFVIDGVPFEPGNGVTNQLVSAANKPNNTSVGGLSPLNTLNPNDIESIEVLKDADATAIYGSRGANGVILITTKKGKRGAATLHAQVRTGWSRVSRTMDMLDTKQYLAMRREAFLNDGQTPANSTAPDLLLWDTTRYTDMKKLLIGHTARQVNAQLSLSGGSETTQFLLSGSFHRESSVFATTLADQVVSFHSSMQHRSADKKFGATFSAYYGNDRNRTIQNDLTRYINLPPHLKLFDSLGKLAWSEGGVNFSSVNSIINPLSLLEKQYRSLNENMSGNLGLSYAITEGLQVKASFGYNRFATDEVVLHPKISIPPTSTGQPFSNFAFATSKSWIIEPQLEWKRTVGAGQLTVLAGTSFQEQQSRSTFITANNYNSDLLLGALAAAGNLTASNAAAHYRYHAVFGRLHYNWKDRYILHFSGRRDGSSRFGPENRFANFGAAGFAWIFTSEPFMNKTRSVLSFGKLRGSYGTTGSDQIGDYSYLDLWSPSTPYAGVTAYQPGSLHNPDYQWSINKKLEIGLELGFFSDRILLSGSFYRNRCGNQLLNYQLPSQAGFGTIVRNLPALVENKGFEFVLSTRNIESGMFGWTSAFNISFPKNRLLSFPGLAASSYAEQFQEGQPLSLFRGYQYLGVDPATGVYTFEDINKDGVINASGDRIFLGHTDPDFFGGFQNAFRLGQWRLDAFFEFRKQKGLNYLAKLATTNFPGTVTNQPVAVLDRWQLPGDITHIEKFSRVAGGPAGLAARNLGQSDAVYSDASFIRLKNISVSYTLPEAWMQKLRIRRSTLFAQAQNVFVLTDYKGSDPEIQDIYVLPPLQTLVIGIQLSL